MDHLSESLGQQTHRIRLETLERAIFGITKAAYVFSIGQNSQGQRETRFSEMASAPSTFIELPMGEKQCIGKMQPLAVVEALAGCGFGFDAKTGYWGMNADNKPIGSDTGALIARLKAGKVAADEFHDVMKGDKAGKSSKEGVGFLTEKTNIKVETDVDKFMAHIHKVIAEKLKTSGRPELANPMRSELHRRAMDAVGQRNATPLGKLKASFRRLWPSKHRINQNKPVSKEKTMNERLSWAAILAAVALAIIACKVASTPSLGSEDQMRFYMVEGDALLDKKTGAIYVLRDAVNTPKRDIFDEIAEEMKIKDGTAKSMVSLEKPQKRWRLFANSPLVEDR